MEEEKAIQKEGNIENFEFSLNVQKIGSSKKKIILNDIEKGEGNSVESNLEVEESLRYDTTYKPVSLDSQNINPKEQNKQNFCRKSSTISTAASLSENRLDTYTPKKSSITMFEKIESPSQMFFGRNRLYSSPICDYYDGADEYFKELYPQEINYEKSHNYLPKEKVLKAHYSSFDLLNQNFEKPKNFDKTFPKLSFDMNYKSFNPAVNRKNSSTNFSYHCNLNKKCRNFDNHSKYFYGYCSVDCKSKNINNVI